jgi:hypothetical protein
MGERASENGHANPSEDPGWLALLAQLDQLLQEAKQSAAQQRDGITKSRGSSELRQHLQAQIRQTHLGHLARVAEAAGEEQPDLEPAFRIRKEARTLRGFRTAAGSMAAVAQSNRELLVKHGLVQSVLDDLVTMLDKFDQAIMQGVEARRQHVGASADLEAIADKIVQVVQLMDGFQRLRFGRDPERLAAWESASTVFATPRSSATAEGGLESGTSESGTPGAGTPGSGASADVRPAA